MQLLVIHHFTALISARMGLSMILRTMQGAGVIVLVRHAAYPLLTALVAHPLKPYTITYAIVHVRLPLT